MTDEQCTYTKNIYALIGPIIYEDPPETAPTCYVDAAGTAYAYADFARMANYNDDVILKVFDMLQGESVEDCLELNSEALELALLREDINSYYQWLEFPGQPDETTLAALHAAGWDFGPGRVQWFHRSYLGRVPKGVSYLYAGECDYASERAGHLKAGAARAVERAQEYKEQSDGLSHDGFLGQPIPAGRRGMADYNRRVRSQDLMIKFAKALNYADALRAEARASRWHQMNKRSRRAIAQRLEVLRGDQRKHQKLLDQARAAEKGLEIDEEERCKVRLSSRQVCGVKSGITSR
jgi:hypothetical protein